MLIPYPTWLTHTTISDVVLVETSPPRPPVIPEPLRPAFGGDALRIADRTREKGDALDAIAQYRAILPRAPATAVPYIELQLARAHMALHQSDEAIQLLTSLLVVEREVSRVRWPAVCL